MSIHEHDEVRELPQANLHRSRVRAFLYRFISILSILLLWVITALWVGDDIIPGPVKVGERFVNIVFYENFLENIISTTTRVIIGLIISLTIATFLGVWMGLKKGAEQFFDGLILGGRVMPGLAWALLAVMVVGVSGKAPVIAVVLAVAPMLTLEIWEGTKALDPQLSRMAAVFRVGPGKRFREVVVPSILPSVAGGAKLGLALSWKVTVLAELFGVDSGVGNEINRNFQIFALDGVLAWSLSFAVVMGLIEYLVVAPIYSHLTRWRRPGDIKLTIGERILRQAAWFRRVRDTRVKETMN